MSQNLVELLFDCGCVEFVHPVSVPSFWPDIVWCPQNVAHGAQRFVILDQRVE